MHGMYLHTKAFVYCVGRRVRVMGHSHLGDTRLEKLLVEKEKRETKIRDYGTKINKLWDKLMVPIDEREEFFERSTQTLGPSAIRSVRHTALPPLSPWFALTRAAFSARTSSNASSRCTGIR